MMVQRSNDLIKEDAIIWRKDFHAYPELGFDLNKTSAKVCEILRGLGITYHQNIGTSGIVGVLKQGQSNRSIALRAEMDAIAIQEKNTFEHCSKHDGKMHACGHDGHMAMLLGAAKKLSKTKLFDGIVYFVFQPDEEHGKGAKRMIEDGLFDRFPIDRIFSLHNRPGLEPGFLSMTSGPIMAAESAFSISIQGKGGHASQPQHCIDPIIIGSEIVIALQSMAQHLNNSQESVVISVTDFQNDGTTNVIANNAVLTGEFRSLSDEMHDKIVKKINDTVASICSHHNAQYEVDAKKLFCPTINSKKEVQAAQNAAIAVNGLSHVDFDSAPMMASDDFGYMLKFRPGAYVFIGNGKESHVLHHNQYDFNDAIIQNGIDFWVQLVSQVLPQP